MTSIPTDQRPCAACGRQDYAATEHWCFVDRIPRCICANCARDGWAFTQHGNAVRGAARVQTLQEQLQAARKVMR